MPDGIRSRILIIDDDDDLLRAISTRLDSLGYECVTARTGEEGISRFRLGGIDLVITDVNMPQGCGFHVGEEIRKASEVPIIVITGFVENYPPLLAGAGAMTFVFKPIDWKRLVRLVEARLAQKGKATAK